MREDRPEDNRDERWMRRALRLARRGEMGVSPNPMVGAVIVRDGRIVGEGWHRHCGGDHAEIDALRRSRESVAGATVYVTLEPCCHHGKTPPCVQSLAAVRPARVVVGTVDPNPLVAGKGLRILEEHGIGTTVGILEAECRALNERFFTFMETGKPFVTLKFAQSLDGRIATAAGDSRWISSEAARRFAHRLRAVHDGILVGAGTVRQDDPELTVRLVRGRNPVRIVLDGALSLPPETGLFRGGETPPTIVAAAPGADRRRQAILEAQGVTVLVLEGSPDGQISLPALLDALGRRGITSLLVEGGGAVITSFLRTGLADRFVSVIAPKILGRGIEAVADLGILRVENAIPLVRVRTARIGPDLVFDARFERKMPPGKDAVSGAIPKAAPRRPACRPGRSS